MIHWTKNLEHIKKLGKCLVYTVVEWQVSYVLLKIRSEISRLYYLFVKLRSEIFHLNYFFELPRGNISRPYCRTAKLCIIEGWPLVSIISSVVLGRDKSLVCITEDRSLSLFCFWWYFVCVNGGKISRLCYRRAKSLISIVVCVVEEQNLLPVLSWSGRTYILSNTLSSSNLYGCFYSIQ